MNRKSPELFAHSAQIFIVILSALAAIFSMGCSSETSEPTGKAVSLSSADFDGLAKEEYKDWEAWQMKGIHLGLSHENQEALYCFHQAITAWHQAQAEARKH